MSAYDDLPTRILWLDLETTGLEEDSLILEIGAVLTDRDLNRIGLPFERVLPASDWMLESRCEDFVKNMHRGTGLWEECAEVAHVTGVHDDAGHAEALAEAEADLLHHLNANDVPLGQIPLGGSGVSAYDRQKIRRQMPNLDEHLTYWSFDVSPMRRLLALAGVEVPAAMGSASRHRALADAEGSLADAQVYVAALRTVDLAALVA